MKRAVAFDVSEGNNIGNIQNYKYNTNDLQLGAAQQNAKETKNKGQHKEGNQRRFRSISEAICRFMVTDNS